MNIYGFLLTIAFTLLTNQVIGQRTCGIVTKNDGVSPIEMAQVISKSTHKGVMTDKNGHFCLEAQDGELLEVSYVGYETQVFPAQSSKATEVKISLRNSIVLFPTIIIQTEFIVRDSFFSVGSGTSINQRELKQLNYTDFNRIAATIAGVNVQEEDGFGLRPNIGIRGSGSTRSSKISLMEDGVLMAPAPYAASAAYYFPTMGRMQGIEILKGSAQIPYGPNTTGGAVNLISAQFTRLPSAQIWMENGTYNTSISHARFSNTHKNISYVAEYFRYGSDGFKTIDLHFPSGFTKTDFLVKLRYQWGGRFKHNVQLKATKTDELSYETYLGVQRQDFDQQPYERYAGSQKDNFEGNHKHMSVRYSLITPKKLEFSTVVYRNQFHRNWYKIGGLLDSSNKSVSIAKIVSNQTAYADLMQILKGASSAEGNLLVKANNRDYYSQGIQSNFGYRLPGNKIRQYLHAGVRIHQDGLDRFQWVDAYTMNHGQMALNLGGTPGSESNLLLDATALSGFVQYDVSWKKWQINPGIRYEDIRIAETNYGKKDPERTGVNETDGSNKNKVIIPGFGFRRTLNPLWSILGGIHRGFSPASVDSGALPELSVNSELGFHLRRSGLEVKAVGFYSAYGNLLTSDAESSGGSGTIKTFNGGKAASYGLELEARVVVMTKNQFAAVLRGTYTYTHSSFLTDFNSDFEGWGTIQSGDYIPYVAPHQGNIILNVVWRRATITLSNRYTGSMRTVAGQDLLNDQNSITPVFLTDLNTQIPVGKTIRLLFGINNLWDRTYAASTWPAGYRPGMPRYVHGGFRLNL